MTTNNQNSGMMALINLKPFIPIRISEQQHGDTAINTKPEIILRILHNHPV